MGISLDKTEIDLIAFKKGCTNTSALCPKDQQDQRRQSSQSVWDKGSKSKETNLTFPYSEWP